jgi:hypothetical protein
MDKKTQPKNNTHWSVDYLQTFRTRSAFRFVLPNERGAIIRPDSRKDVEKKGRKLSHF